MYYRDEMTKANDRLRELKGDFLLKRWLCRGTLIPDDWTSACFFLCLGSLIIKWRQNCATQLLLTFCHLLLLLLCFLRIFVRKIVSWHRSVDLEEKLVMFNIMFQSKTFVKKRVSLVFGPTWPRKHICGLKTGLGSTHLSEKQSNSRDLSRECRLILKESLSSILINCKNCKSCRASPAF